MRGTGLAERDARNPTRFFADHSFSGVQSGFRLAAVDENHILDVWKRASSASKVAAIRVGDSSSEAEG